MAAWIAAGIEFLVSFQQVLSKFSITSQQVFLNKFSFDLDELSQKRNRN